MAGTTLVRMEDFLLAANAALYGQHFLDRNLGDCMASIGEYPHPVCHPSLNNVSTARFIS